MSWKTQLGTYKQQHAVDQQVGNVTWRFYPNQVGVLEDVRDLSRPIAAALGTLFADTRNDVKSVEEKFTERDGSFANRMTVEGISPDLLDRREKQRREALEGLMGLMADRKNQMHLGKLWMDSLCDLFPRKRGGPTPQEVEEFLYGDGQGYEGLSVPQMVDIMQGWLKANSKVFGTVGERLVGFVKEKLRLLNELTPQQETSPTNGDSSKTQSLQPSDTVSA